MEQVLRNEANSDGRINGEHREQGREEPPGGPVRETKPISGAKENPETTDWLRLYKLRLRTIPTTRRTRLAIC